MAPAVETAAPLVLLPAAAAPGSAASAAGAAVSAAGAAVLQQRMPQGTPAGGGAASDPKQARTAPAAAVHGCEVVAWRLQGLEAAQRGVAPRLKRQTGGTRSWRRYRV